MPHPKKDVIKITKRHFSESVDWEFANKEIKEQYGIDLKHEKEIMQRKLNEGKSLYLIYL